MQSTDSSALVCVVLALGDETMAQGAGLAGRVVAESRGQLSKVHTEEKRQVAAWKRRRGNFFIGGSGAGKCCRRRQSTTVRPQIVRYHQEVAGLSRTIVDVGAPREAGRRRQRSDSRRRAISPTPD